MSPLPDAGCSPTTSQIRDALGQILASENFSRSPKISRLLTYLVEQKITGDAEQLKEIAIATDVFDQQDDFNPRTNPIVRVNASRLRNLLRLYYAEAGAHSVVRIMLPDVGYTPIFNKLPEKPNEPQQSEALHTTATLSARGEAAEASSPNPAPSSDGSCRGISNRFGKVLGLPSSVAFVLANLVIACVFAVLINRSDTRADGHLIFLPASGQEEGANKSRIMLCSNDSELETAYPVVIGKDTMFCRPLMVPQTLPKADPV